MVQLSDTPAEVEEAPAGRRTLHLRRRALVATLLVGVAALAAGFWLSRANQAATRDGSAILAMVLPDADGREQPLAQWRGRILIVNFWATWCAPCREEMPHFVAAQARDGAKGVQFVGIAVDEPAKVRTYAREIGLNYPALIGGYGAVELSKTLGNDLSALPFTIVLDRDGRVAHTQLGPLEPRKLDALLAGLLKES
jgi:thiol-disulfide isomerase/thioredoxin